MLRILEYARAHLPEPGLNAAQIAAAHHISVRHLYNILARGGISLGDWMRTRRLEGCRDELSRPQWRPEHRFRRPQARIHRPVQLRASLPGRLRRLASRMAGNEPAQPHADPGKRRDSPEVPGQLSRSGSR